ncbi:MAG TPA: hypothetical protein VFK69_01575 [Candidatus Eisenbacteria bacterium]|nr:hypothetical protein [Candidatus Eisenbacteria bacterium]
MTDADPALPDLRFVPVESLVPHEWHDEHRFEPLVRRLRDSGVLRNPPVVAAAPDDSGRWVVLDGANRASAIRAAGLPHVVVQVVRYEEPDVRLTTWSHALSGVARAAFQGACARIPGLAARADSLLHARATLARRECVAVATYPGGEATTLQGGADLRERNQLLNGIVDVYRRQRFHRTASEIPAHVFARHPDVTVLVIFPHFEPSEVLELAISGERLPAGITRHLIRWRALRVNVPLERLADTGATLEQKNAWLAQWLAERATERQVRFYEEPTVLFDE